MEYEPVIGLEVHVQLKTTSKIFSRAPYRYGEAPNTLTDPVVMGLPGTLPVMNKAAIEQCVRLGLLLKCEIAEYCKWDRKNYFYPDNPKNYQISQYDMPLCIGGEVEIELPGSSRNVMGEHRTVKLTRIHLEEDPGKLSHESFETLIDFNRCGVALAEIVTEPDLYSAEEAAAFLNALRIILAANGVSDCDMEKGQLRCDANVSLRPKGNSKLGTRTEMKNLNSVSNVKAAIESEIRRQTRELNAGRAIDQETRRWAADEGTSYTLRGKEEAHDYRYFPDPDLMPVKFPREKVEQLKSELCELPYDRQRRYLEQYDLPYTVTSVLIPDRKLCEFFEEAVKLQNNPKMVANYLVNELLRELSAAGESGEGALDIEQSKVKPAHIADLVNIIDEGVISKQIAKDVFIEMFNTGKMASAIVEEKGLAQSSDTGELEAICAEAVANNEKAAQQFRDGNDKAINAIKGQVMKATKGKANPQLVDEIVKRIISGS